jgi:ornithine cyclodeaminase/alanine dehydrogenase-like protein (mu-crystallin family)
LVDARATTLHHIGELKIALDQGIITESDVVADYYDLATGAFARKSEDEITLFKNGGGAHLDLMTARYILSKWR